ncbi:MULTISPECIES: hypothetical protein [Chitinophagaceae]
MPKQETLIKIGGGKRPHLKVTRLFDSVGLNYSLSKYLPTKNNLFQIGKLRYVRIDENYLHIPLDGVLQGFYLNLFFDTPYMALRRLIEYHEERFGFGLSCINPRTGRKSELVIEDSKIRYTSPYRTII